jgi:hypothetical protein
MKKSTVQSGVSWVICEAFVSFEDWQREGLIFFKMKRLAKG